MPVTDTPRPEDLPALVERGLRMVDERLQRAPDFGLYLSIQRQLQAIRDTLAAGERPTDALLDRLLLGVYAAREFETSDPAFADVLFNVEYLFKRL